MAVFRKEVDKTKGQLEEHIATNLEAKTHSTKENLKILEDLMQKHEDEMNLSMTLAGDIKGEAETFRTLSLIKHFFKEAVKLYEIDFNINSTVQSLKTDFQDDRELGTAITKINEMRMMPFTLIWTQNGELKWTITSRRIFFFAIKLMVVLS